MVPLSPQLGHQMFKHRSLLGVFHIRPIIPGSMSGNERLKLSLNTLNRKSYSAETCLESVEVLRKQKHVLSLGELRCLAELVVIPVPCVLGGPWLWILNP